MIMIALTFTFDMPKILVVCPGAKTDSRIWVEVENAVFPH